MGLFTSFVKFWKKPHPFIFNKSSVIIPFLVTLLVLIVFRPFNFAEYSTTKLLLLAIVFSVVPVLCLLLVMGAILLIPSRLFDEENWTIGKEITLILSVLVVISLALFALFYFVGTHSTPLDLLQTVFLRTVLISVFPILVLVLYEQYAHQKKQWNAATRINKELMRQQKESQPLASALVPLGKIRLMGENQKMALQVDAEQLVYAQSEGNYVDVYHLSDGMLTKTLVRNSLKAIEEQLQFDHFFRCHRSFIISTLHIQKVDGNARNLEITLEHTQETIPVARSKSKELLTMLNVANS